MSLVVPPQPARWFELLCVGEDLFAAMTTLAAMDAVELEEDRTRQEVVLTPELARKLSDFARMKEKFAPFWPAALPRSAALPMASPERLLTELLTGLEGWSREAVPLIESWNRQQALRQELELWLALLALPEAETLPFTAFLPREGVVRAALFVLPVTAPVPAAPEETLLLPLRDELRLYLVAMGPAARLQALQTVVAALKGRPVEPFPWFTDNPRENAFVARHHLKATLAESARLREELDRLNARYELAAHLGRAALLEWFFGHVEKTAAVHAFVWITGWTAKREEQAWNEALSRAGVRGLVAFPPPPAGKCPPLRLKNPPWAKPFELFPNLLGQAGLHEADPSRLLAFVAPLLFGYMFGDVGQGLVLVAVGLFFSRRFPQMALLTVFGASATVFGFFFGSVFCVETLLPPLLLHPMAHPLEVLGVPLVFGAGILTLGLALKLVQVHWRGGEPLLWSEEAAMITLYLGLLALLFGQGWLLELGLVHFTVAAWRRHPSPVHLLQSLAGLLEHLMQLAVNTLSFARVGAFALAHGGLSIAVVALGETTGSPFGEALTLLVGNAVILVLEGLVVSVQTTRLILFEFFVRFLKAEGRPFRPLPAPPG